MEVASDPLVLALHFGAFSLPTLVFSGLAGVLTDRLSCEKILVRAQLALLGTSSLGALAISLLGGTSQVLALLGSSALIGVASSFEITARSKYCALLVPDPEQLAGYLTSFSVVFNIGKLIGPLLGGYLVKLAGPTIALTLDTASYLLPIISIIWLLQPNQSQVGGHYDINVPLNSSGSLLEAWRTAGSTLRHVLIFTSLICTVSFFHPGLAPVIASRVLGPSPSDLGLFTSILAAGSISGGILLQRNSLSCSKRPFLTLGAFALITALAQLGMASNAGILLTLLMMFLIGAGTAGLLSSTNLITQVASPQILRGRMASLSQIAFLGGGGLSGLLAALLSIRIGLSGTFATAGTIGILLTLRELWQRGQTVLPLQSAIRST